MFKINGNIIKTPSSIQLEILDIDGGSQRNAKGDLIRDRISTKRKLSVEWSVLTQNEIAAILNQISSIFFNITYIDAQESEVTKTFYVGNRSMPVCRFVNGQPLWENLKCDFIER